MMMMRLCRPGAPLAPHVAGTHSMTRPGRHVQRLRAFDFEDKLEDTPGVDSLLERDMRQIELNETAFEEGSSSSSQPKKAVQPTSRPKPAGGDAGPRLSREAIDLGLAAFAAGEHRAAIDLFTLALELPGSGAMRLSGSVHERACASEGEERAALFNMACAYAQLREKAAALTCVEALLETGFEDHRALRTDDDLAPIAGPELEALLSKHSNPLRKLPFVGGGSSSTEAKPKPWYLW